MPWDDEWDENAPDSVHENPDWSHPILKKFSESYPSTVQDTIVKLVFHCGGIRIRIFDGTSMKLLPFTGHTVKREWWESHMPQDHSWQAFLDSGIRIFGMDLAMFAGIIEMTD